MNIKKEEQREDWWNMPVFGANSLVERIEHAFHKEEVPENVIAEYKQAMAELRIVASVAKALDNPKFSNEDFLFYLRINNYVAKEIGEYRGLKSSFGLFRVAIEAKNSFIKIELLEMKHCSSKQQEFYNFVTNLLNKDLTEEELSKKIQSELNIILPSIMTEEGRNALENYAATIESLAKIEPLGLKLVYLFKKYEMTDFSIIKKMGDLVDYLLDLNKFKLDNLVSLVDSKIDIFDSFAKIINMPLEQRIPVNYAKMLQYLTLRKRHFPLFSSFQKLAELLAYTDKFYRTVLEIQEKYCTKEYKIIEEFKAEIPGLEIYAKYKDYLFATEND